MLYFVVVALQKYGGEDGLQMTGRSQLSPLDLNDKLTFYYLVLAVFVIVLIVCRRLVESHFGMVLRGCRQNERRMRAIGFATYRYRLAAFIISGALAGRPSDG
jgi:branched-chain amino acid transport system permease protein